MGWHHDQVWLFTVSEFDNARSWIPGKHGLRELGSGKVGWWYVRGCTRSNADYRTGRLAHDCEGMRAQPAKPLAYVTSAHH